MNLTVILTSYNHENVLRESIDSVLRQTYQNFQFIIVDDCSTDRSWDIICEYKNRYPEIMTIRHDYNWGGGVVEDTVKKYATGDYIAIHHSDDVWEKDKLSRQVEIFYNQPDCAAVFTNAIAIDDQGNNYKDEQGFYYHLFAVQNRSRHEWLNYFFYKGNCLCHPSILVKKSVYEEDGFFRKGLKQIPDFVKWIQICKKHEIYVLPEALVKFRIHSNGKNTSGMSAITQIRSTIELFLMLDEYRKIEDREEFLKIFPEAKEFCNGNYFTTEYVLGRLCTQKGMPSYTRMYGIQLLYEVLNKQDDARQIKEDYNYTEKSFREENGKYDIFGILPKGFEQKRTLYYDLGNGFNSDECIRQNFILEKKEAFEMSCTIVFSSDQSLKKLRFDPGEEVMLKVKIRQVLINGCEAAFYPENALNSVNDEDFFVTLDPIYNIAIPDDCIKSTDNEANVIIRGTVTRLSDEEIGELATILLYDIRGEKHETGKKQLEMEKEIQNLRLNNQVICKEKKQLVDKNKSLAAECSELKRGKEKLEAENDRLKQEFTAENERLKQEFTAENERLKQELASIKEHFLYKCYVKFRGKE